VKTTIQLILTLCGMAPRASHECKCGNDLALVRETLF
jgi:hypothetical protein